MSSSSTDSRELTRLPLHPQRYSDRREAFPVSYFERLKENGGARHNCLIKFDQKFTEKYNSLTEKDDLLFTFLPEKLRIRPNVGFLTFVDVVQNDMIEYFPQLAEESLRKDESLAVRLDFVRKVETLLRYLDAHDARLWLQKDLTQTRPKLYGTVERLDSFFVIRQKCNRVRVPPVVELERPVAWPKVEQGLSDTPAWSQPKNEEKEVKEDDQAFLESQLKLLELYEEESKTKKRVPLRRPDFSQDNKTKRVAKEEDPKLKEEEDFWRSLGA